MFVDSFDEIITSVKFQTSFTGPRVLLGSPSVHAFPRGNHIGEVFLIHVHVVVSQQLSFTFLCLNKFHFVVALVVVEVE